MLMLLTRTNIEVDALTRVQQNIFDHILKLRISG